MRRILSLRLGTVVIAGLFWVTQKENGQYDIDSKPVAHRHIRLLKDFGFNVTFKVVTQVTLGELTKNGSYNGLLGLIGRNEADTIVIPAETFIKDPPGDFGPVVCSFPHVIMTHVLSPNITIADLLTATNMFDTPTYTLLTIIPFIWLLIMGAASSAYSLWNIITMALGQNFNTYWDCSKRLLHSALLFMFLFLEFVFLSSYSTDMAVVQPPKLIKTLEDLYSSSLKPIFLKSDNLYAQFMNSESTRYSNVWKKVQQCGLDNCLLEGNFDMVAKLDFSPSKRDVAMVYSTAYLPAMVNYMCNILGKSYKEVKEEGQRVFNSQPFSSVNLAFVINRNTESNLRQRIVEFSYFVIESGYIEKGWKDSEQFVEPVYGCNCPHTIFEDEKTVTLPDPVSLSIFNRVLIAFLVAVGFGVIILLTEITVSRLRNSSNLAVIEPDSVPPTEHVSVSPTDTVSVTSTEANSKVEGTSGGSHMDGLNDETNQNFEENND